MFSKETYNIVRSTTLANVLIASNTANNTTIGCIIENLKLYKRYKEEKTLELLLAYMCLYLELGYDFYEYEKIFNQILSYKGISKADFLDFAKKQTAISLELTKANIKRIIGRWYPANNGITSQGVVEDILFKCKNFIIGTHKYQSKNKKNNLILEIIDNECYIYNINNGRFYRLIV